MELLEKIQDREKVLEQLRKEMNQHIQSKRIPIYSLFAEKAQRANIAFSPLQLLLVMITAASVAFAGITFAINMHFVLRVFASLFIGFGGVYYWISIQAKKRAARLEEQLPDAIELMVRSLRVGHPLIAAISSVAKELPDPLGSEFGVIADESVYGRSLVDSLKQFAERMENQDLRFLAIAVSIQQTSGGNLAEILDGLSKVIRSRFKLYRRVSVITAEGRFSGKFLSSMPFVVLIGNLIFRPGYYDKVMESPLFAPAAFAVVIMIAINILLIRALTAIKV
jgi:tight adherence protein B